MTSQLDQAVVDSRSEGRLERDEIRKQIEIEDKSV